MDFANVLDPALKIERDAARRVIEVLHMQFIAGTDVDLDLLTEQFNMLTAVELELLRRGFLPSDACMKKSTEASQMVRAIRQNEVPGQNQQEEHLLDLEPPREKPYRPVKEKIPTFEEGYVDFAIFKLIFDRLVHNNGNYSIEEKATFLLEHVKGPARKIILPYLSRSGAYQLMYAALESVYTKDDLLKEHLKKDIDTLPKMNGKSDAKLIDFKNEVSRITNTIEMCTEKGDDFRRNSYAQVISKFDNDTKLELARKCSDLDELVKRLEKWSIAKERMEAMNIRPTTARPSTDKPNRFKSAAAQASSKCAFCSGEHRTRECSSGIPAADRRIMTQEKRLCYMCLESGHRLRSGRCSMKGKKCTSCNGYHHQSICSPRQPPQQQSETSNTPETVNSRVMSIREPTPLNNVYNIGAVMFESFVDNSPYLRATVNGQSVRILLDTGSDKTLIARHLLRPRDVFRGDGIVVAGIGGIEPCDEVSRFYITGPDITPIGFYGYVMNQLPNTDIIIGRFDIPSLLKDDVTQGKRDYFDTVFGQVRYTQQEVTSRVVSNRAFCRAVFAGESLNLNEFLKEVSGEEAEEPAFQLDIRQLASGRYCVKLPFTPGCKLDNNFFHAKRRLERLQLRLIRKPGQMEKYEDQLMQYVKDGHAIRLLGQHQPWRGLANYMPHREVEKETSETTKMRIVFDCGAGKPSLNDRLFKGDADSLNLFESLMQFRMKPVAVIADISKAFLQIEIAQEDQRFLRYLWQKGEEIHVYQMTRLPFGLVTSPAVLIKAIQLQIAKYETIYPETAMLLKRAFYMDDVTTSVDTPEEAEKVKREACIIFNDAHFVLCKWSSNLSDLMKAWDPNRDVQLLKVLGLMWNLPNDALSIKVEWKPLDEPFTPRLLMKLIGTLFDPKGFVEPVKLRLKELFREAAKVTPGWDLPIPQEISAEVTKIEHELPQLTTIAFPRHVPTPTVISVFCDASTRGYGFIVCLTDAIERNYFLYAKSRLAPTKKARTIPELELAALTEAVKNVPLIRRYYDQENVKTVVWSDSSITLCRLVNDVNKYGPYVGNRLLQVHRICEQYPIEFRYVPTDKNPADCYSRPKTVGQFLKAKPYQLDLNISQLLKEADECHLPKVNLCCVSQSTPKKKRVEPTVEIPGYEAISEWSKMVARTRRIIQFAFLKLKYLKEATVQQAMIYLFKRIQAICIADLPNEVGTLPTERDENGLIRVRTRNAEDRPIWIPQSSRLALLLVRHCHSVAMHMRRRFTKALVNDNYYIRGINRLVDRVLKNCVECQKERRKSQLITQPTGDLPLFRTQPYLPFECVGIDYYGPLKLKNKRKVWVLIVTCSVSRAIHLEVVHDLSAEACLVALNSAFNLRGMPQVIVSDNGSNFTRAEKDLRRLRNLMRNDVQHRQLEFNIKWYFDPPRSPWWGGFFERMIGTVKRAMGKLSNLKNVEQLRNVLTEAMSIVNSRPLLSTDSEKDTCITPGHYLIGRSFKSVPRGHRSMDSFKSLNLIKVARRRFLKFWKSEYLRSLSLKRKDALPIDLKEGELVLICEPDDSETWKLARIETVERGADKVIRQVTVLFPDGTTNGPPNDGGRRRTGRSRKILMRTAQNLAKLELDQPGPAECDGKLPSVNVIYDDVQESEEAHARTTAL